MDRQQQDCDLRKLPEPPTVEGEDVTKLVLELDTLSLRSDDVHHVGGNIAMETEGTKEGTGTQVQRVTGPGETEGAGVQVLGDTGAAQEVSRDDQVDHVEKTQQASRDCKDGLDFANGYSVGSHGDSRRLTSRECELKEQDGSVIHVSSLNVKDGQLSRPGGGSSRSNVISRGCRKTSEQSAKDNVGPNTASQKSSKSLTSRTRRTRTRTPAPLQRGHSGSSTASQSSSRQNSSDNVQRLGCPKPGQGSSSSMTTQSSSQNRSTSSVQRFSLLKTQRGSSSSTTTQRSSRSNGRSSSSLQRFTLPQTARCSSSSTTTVDSETHRRSRQQMWLNRRQQQQQAKAKKATKKVTKPKSKTTSSGATGESDELRTVREEVEGLCFQVQLYLDECRLRADDDVVNESAALQLSLGAELAQCAQLKLELAFFIRDPDQRLQLLLTQRRVLTDFLRSIHTLEEQRQKQSLSSQPLLFYGSITLTILAILAMFIFYWHWES